MNFYGSFPPRRFSVPGSFQAIDPRALEDGVGSTQSFDDPGRYYVACLFWPPDEAGSTMRPASLLEVSDGPEPSS